ncbi:hypothetical protein M758_10G052100 [Ceratodon purpureus]|nr:hypothetical protein M758_10G052100 [Ceratodon purpureus]
MITRSRGGGASNMESGGEETGVPLSMIPLLEVAYSKCQEEEKDTDGMQGQGQKGAWPTRQEQEEAGKKRKRSSNWSEAETLQLLVLRKGQLQNKEERKSCPKGSSAWDEIASQLKEKFTHRSGKHVGERWDTLRRVYMDIEEHCSKTHETYAEVLDANRDLFKFIPTEYTQKWHELIADCKPGKRRGKKTNEVVSLPKVAASPLLVEATPSRTEPTIEDYLSTSYKAPIETCPEGNVTQLRIDRAPADAAHIEFRPSELSPTLVAHPSGIASAFDTLIKDIDHILSCQNDHDKSGQMCGRNRRTRDSDERAETNGVGLAEDTDCDAKVKVVASLQSVLAALKSASEFTSSESYLLKIDKRELNLVEHNVRAFSERHSNIEQTRFNGVETTFRKVVWPPDDPDPVIVTHDDIKSLEPGEQLSDNIVNFYLKYLHCKNTRIPDVQIFKPFTKNISANLNAVKYGSVRQWMRSIFDKNYVLIPVFKEELWSLVIICFPGRPLAEVLESRVLAPCILHLNPSRQKAHLDLERHIRFILLMEWIWQYGGNVVPRQISDIPFHSVGVPQQENSNDAGLFILQHAELLLKNAPETFNLAQSIDFPFLTEWFGASTAMTMRTTIRQVLLDMNDQEVLQKHPNRG